jgi:hypothetical protein
MSRRSRLSGWWLVAGDWLEQKTGDDRHQWPAIKSVSYVSKKQPKWVCFNIKT